MIRAPRRAFIDAPDETMLVLICILEGSPSPRPPPRPSPPRRGRIAVRHLAIRRVQATKSARRRWQGMERIIKQTRKRHSLSLGERVRVRASQYYYRQEITFKQRVNF